MSLSAPVDMAEARMEHPTAGRRGDTRVHQYCMPSPPFQSRDWKTRNDTENGPSDEDGEKDAKRQRSEPIKMKKWRTNLKQKIDLQTGDDLEVMLRPAERCDNGLGLYQDHHFRRPMLNHPLKMRDMLRDLK